MNSENQVMQESSKFLSKRGGVMNDTGTYDSSVMESLRNFRADRQLNKRKLGGKITCHNPSHISSLTKEFVNFRDLDESVCSDEFNRDDPIHNLSLPSAEYYNQSHIYETSNYLS